VWLLCHRYLLNAGDADANVKNALGDTALMVASSVRTRCNCVRLLLSENADVNAQNLAGKTALIIATTSGLMKTAALLLEGGCNIWLEWRTDTHAHAHTKRVHAHARMHTQG
jgi:ankyrin repeat protein